MNYRHAFHAGNFADVFKHVLLTRILVYLTRKPAALRFIDTHAGVGRYDLSGGEAQRTGEWRDGIGRLFEARPEGEIGALLAPYMAIVGAGNTEGRPNSYPGSPAIAQSLLRRQDRLILCELNPADARKAEAEFADDRRIKVIAIDGYTGLRAYVPPVERRGLVLIDPPFEDAHEFANLEQNFLAAYAKWRSGIYALWYPLKIGNAGEILSHHLVGAGVRRLLRLELGVDAILSDGPLSACGLIIVNPPFGLEEEARLLLPALGAVLGKGSGAMHRAVAIGLD